MITVDRVTKRFGDFAALDDVSLTVPEGSLTALLGPSGSGKSTLLRVIAGLEAPDAGTVTIDGADATSVAPQKRGIGFVFQHYAAFKHMTVRDNVAFGLRVRKRPKAEITQTVDELLRIVGLDGYQSRYPAPVSRLGDTLVRPHDLRVHVEPRDGALEAQVARVVHLGFEVRVELELDRGEPLPVQLTRDEAAELELRAGDIVWVRRPAVGAASAAQLA